MAILMRRRAPTTVVRAVFPDLPDSLQTALLAFSSAQTFRVEELVRDGHYLIRAELPGLDPATDIEVTLDGNMLRIHAERCQQEGGSYRTEFRYGSATRSVRLPARVDPHDITARYQQGILEISLPVPPAKPDSIRIPIQDADAADSAAAAESYKPGQVVPRDGTVECARHHDVQDHVTAGTRFAPCSHHHEHSEGCTWQYISLVRRSILRRGTDGDLAASRSATLGGSGAHAGCWRCSRR
jgi:HSP20 family protein